MRQLSSALLPRAVSLPHPIKLSTATAAAAAAVRRFNHNRPLAARPPSHDYASHTHGECEREEDSTVQIDKLPPNTPNCL